MWSRQPDKQYITYRYNVELATIGELATEHGVSETTMQKTMDAMGIIRRKARHSTQVRVEAGLIPRSNMLGPYGQALEILYTVHGFSTYDLALCFPWSQASILAYLKGQGVVRERGQAIGMGLRRRANLDTPVRREVAAQVCRDLSLDFPVDR